MYVQHLTLRFIILCWLVMLNDYKCVRESFGNISLINFSFQKSSKYRDYSSSSNALMYLQIKSWVFCQKVLNAESEHNGKRCYNGKYARKLSVQW